MVLTLIPAMPSFAATANRVDRVVSVTSDGNTLTNSPNLLIDADGKNDISTAQVFRVELADGADWGTNAENNVTITNGSVSVLRISDKRLEVTINSAASNSIIKIPVAVQFDGAPEGAQKVKVVALNSGVTAGEYTYATVGASDVTMKVDSKVKISRSGDKEVSIIIDETAVGSFDDTKDYTLKLPKEFAWANASASGVGSATVGTDTRELLINVNGSVNTKLESIFVTADIVPSRDAKFGDVTVNVTRGDISPSSLVVAEYVDYVGVVKVDKVLDVVSGKDEDALYVAKVKIEEPVAGTLLENRFIELSFNKDNASLEDGETLKLTKKSGTGALSIDGTSSKALTGNGLTSAIETEVAGKLVDSHQWDIKVVTTSAGATAAKYELEIPFVVSALYEGDVVLTVQGAGIEKQDVVIAKAKKPVTIEIDKNSSADLKIGLQKQSAPDIIITETEAGALSEDVLYSIANRYANSGIIWRNAKIEVIEGDLELNDDDTDYVQNGVEIKVDTKSTKASKIKISGVEVTLDRTVPYGPFEVNFNFGVTGTDYNNLSSRVDRKAYFNVVTPAPGDQNATTTFTMDSTTYTMIINGQPQQMTMDVAPFIQDNRAMLPIKFVADAIGAKVNYDPMSRVATFTKDATVAALYLDSNILYVNGTPVTMDTKPVISNGRAMVPVIYVAQAFGFQYGTDLIYDAATRSVTIFPK